MSTRLKESPFPRWMALVGAIALLIVILWLVASPEKKPDVMRRAAERVPRPRQAREEAHQEARAEEAARQDRVVRQEEAQAAHREIIDDQKLALAGAEAERLATPAQHEKDERRRKEAEQAQRDREARLAEQRRLAAQREREEAARRRVGEFAEEREVERLARLEAEERERLEEETRLAAAAAAEAEAVSEEPAEIEDTDDTPDVETETTISAMERRRGWKISGDLRPIMDGLHEESRDGSTESDAAPGLRARIGADFGITRRLHVGTRIAGTGFVGNFNPNFILPGNLQDSSELESGTIGFDQLYLHWQGGERFNLAVGRLQTRFQLRGGVYAKSLDRNNSHNWRVNWTDGLQATLRTGGWTSNFVIQVNPHSGPTGVRRNPLDFDDEGARRTYFLGFENLERKSAVVQKAFDISYLPASLLKDGDPDERRTDYWGFVGRLMFVWPPKKEGPRLRAGTEIGYAPETPTFEAVSLSDTGDVSGFAWNVVISAMDFAPGHSIGLNYARTGAGWLISPQYRPNHELIELRHMWRSKKFPLLETRIRRRTELDQQIGTVRPRTQYDFFVRLTYRFTLLEE
jgi:hypothetical protein